MFLGHFLTIFVHYYLMGIFSKKSGSVLHNHIWAPNTMVSFRKSMDGRMDGRLDRQTPYFIGPFWPRPGVQKVKIPKTSKTNINKEFSNAAKQNFLCKCIL